MPDMLDMPLDDIIMKNTGSNPTKGGVGNNRVGPVKGNRRGNNQFQGKPRQMNNNTNSIPRNRNNTSKGRFGREQAPTNTSQNGNRGRRPHPAPRVEGENNARARIHARIARDTTQANSNNKTGNRQRNSDANPPYSDTPRRNHNRTDGRNSRDSNVSRQRSTQNIINRNPPPQNFARTQQHKDNYGRGTVPNLQIAITNERARPQPHPTGRMYSDYYGNTNHSEMEPYQQSVAAGPRAKNTNSSLSTRFATTAGAIRRL